MSVCEGDFEEVVSDARVLDRGRKGVDGCNRGDEVVIGEVGGGNVNAGRDGDRVADASEA